MIDAGVKKFLTSLQSRSGTLPYCQAGLAERSPVQWLHTRLTLLKSDPSDVNFHRHDNVARPLCDAGIRRGTISEFAGTAISAGSGGNAPRPPYRTLSGGPIAQVSDVSNPAGHPINFFL